jgi:hypothetical protein
VQPVFGDVTDAPSLRAALDGCATVYHVAGVPEQWRGDVSELGGRAFESRRSPLKRPCKSTNRHRWTAEVPVAIGPISVQMSFEKSRRRAIAFTREAVACGEVLCFLPDP